MSLAKNIFEDTECLETIVRRIMRQAQDLLQCERCTVYILNKNIPPEEEEVKKSFLSNTILAKKNRTFSSA